MLSGLKCDFWHVNVHFTDGAPPHHLMIFSEPAPTKIDAPPMGRPPPLKNEVPTPLPYLKNKPPPLNMKHPSMK